MSFYPSLITTTIPPIIELVWLYLTIYIYIYISQSLDPTYHWCTFSLTIMCLSQSTHNTSPSANSHAQHMHRYRPLDPPRPSAGGRIRSWWRRLSRACGELQKMEWLKGGKYGNIWGFLGYPQPSSMSKWDFLIFPYKLSSYGGTPMTMETRKNGK